MTILEVTGLPVDIAGDGREFYPTTMPARPLARGDRVTLAAGDARMTGEVRSVFTPDGRQPGARIAVVVRFDR